MICRRCGADVAPTKFCSKCGVLLNGKRCNTCGAIMGANESFCAECGTPPASYSQSNGAPNNYPGGGFQPAAQSNPQPQLATSLKKRPRRQPQPLGNKHTRLRGLIGGLGGLAALAVMLYFYVFGDLLMIGEAGNAVSYSPLLFDADTLSYSFATGSINLFENFGQITSYFTAFAASFGNAIGNMETLGAMFAQLPGLIFQLAYFIGMLLLAIAVIIAVLKFLIGLIRGKEFDLMFPVELGLISLISMYLAYSLIPSSVSPGEISLTSGLMFGIYAGAAAVLLQVILNLGLAGKRFFKTGAVMKFITNIGFFAGAAIMLFNMPRLLGEVDIMTTFGASTGAIVNGIELTDYAMYGYFTAMAVLLFGFVWGLAANAAKAAKRTSRTFKFDGYADKGCVFKAFRWVIAAVGFAVLAYLAVDELSNTVIMFAVGSIVMFLFAILNRIFLNRDQLG